MKSEILLVFFLLVNAVVELSAEKGIVNISYSTPRVVEALKTFLRKSLDSDGVDQRYLLIRAGVVPAPPDNENLETEGSGMIQELQFTVDTYNHFKKHVSDILESRAQFDRALYLMFGEPLHPIYFIYSRSAWKAMMSENQNYHKYSVADIESSGGTLSSHDTTEVPQSSLSPAEECMLKHGKESSACAEYEADSEDLSDSSGYANLNEAETEYLSESNYATDAAATAKSIAKEFINFVSKESESTTLSNLYEVSNSEHSMVTEETFTSTPSDDELVTFPMSSSDTSSSLTPNKDSSSTDYLSVQFENSSNSEQSDFIESLRAEESKPIHFSPITEKALTVEEVQFLDETLRLTPEVKYTIRDQPDQFTISDVQFHTVDTKVTPSTFLDNSSKLSVAPKKKIPRDIRETIESYTIEGRPGVDFPNYDFVPEDTSFTCEGKEHIPGFYADGDTRCQVFHVCWPGRRESFLCPLGTIFNQAILACDLWQTFNCSDAIAYHGVNRLFTDPDDPDNDYNVESTTRSMINTLTQATKKGSGVRPQKVRKMSDITELFETDVSFSEDVAHEDLRHIWKFLPIQAKVFAQPEPQWLEELKKRKHKRSQDEKEVKPNSDQFAVGQENKQLDKQHKVASILRALKKLSANVAE